MRYILFILLLSSCSAEWHAKRACKKDPLMCNESFVFYDTVVKTDSTRYYDTFVTSEYDTITIDTGSIKLKIIRRTDSIFVDLEKRPDTISISAKIKVGPRIVVKEEKNYIDLILILSIFVAIQWILRKKN